MLLKNIWRYVIINVLTASIDSWIYINDNILI